jgi:hypothetical protein
MKAVPTYFKVLSVDFPLSIEGYHQEYSHIAGRELSVGPLDYEMGATIHLRLLVGTFIYKTPSHLLATEAIMLYTTLRLPHVSTDKFENLLLKEFISKKTPQSLTAESI